MNFTALTSKRFNQYFGLRGRWIVLTGLLLSIMMVINSSGCDRVTDVASGSGSSVSETSGQLPDDSIVMGAGEVRRIIPEGIAAEGLTWKSSNWDSLYVENGIVKVLNPVTADVIVSGKDTYDSFKIIAQGEKIDEIKDDPEAAKYKYLASRKVINTENKAIFKNDENVDREEFISMMAGVIWLTADDNLDFLTGDKSGNFFTKIFGTLFAQKNLTNADAMMMATNAYKYYFGKDAELADELINLFGESEIVTNRNAILGLYKLVQYMDNSSDYFTYKDGILQITLDNRMKMYEPGDTVNCKIAVDADEDIKYASIELVNNQNSATQTRKIEAADIEAINGKMVFGGSFTVDLNGIYSVSVSLFDEGDVSLSTEKVDIGVMPKAAAVADDSFYFGAHPGLAIQFSLPAHTKSFSNRDYTYDYQFDLMKYMGVNLIRVGMGLQWNDMQASEGSPMDHTKADRLITSAAERGITVDWIISSITPWSVREEYIGKEDAFALEKFGETVLPWYKCPPDLVKYQAYIDELASHYSKYDNIIFELDNEPNYGNFMGTPEEYIELLRIAGTAFKAKNPNLKVTNGGLVPKYVFDEKHPAYRYGAKDDAPYYAGLQNLLKDKLVDFVSYHSHMQENLLRTSFGPAMEKYTKEYKIPDSVLFLNESGAAIDPTQNAIENLKKIVWTKGKGYAGIVQYHSGISNPSSAMYEYEKAWGTISSRGEPTETIIAYGAAIRFLDRTVNDFTKETSKALIFGFTKDNKSIISAYKKSDSDNIVLKVDKDKTYKCYDYLGNPVIPDENNSVSLNDGPSYFIFDELVDENAISEVVGEKHLFENGTFDMNLDGWIGQEAILKADKTEKFSGPSSMKVDKTISYGYPYYVVSLEAGKTYNFSAMFKSSNGAQVAAGLIVWNEDSSDVLAYMDIAVSDEAGSSGWTELKTGPEGFTFAPDGVYSNVWLYFTHLPNGNMNSYWVDDVKLTELVP